MAGENSPDRMMKEFSSIEVTQHSAKHAFQEVKHEKNKRFIHSINFPLHKLRLDKRSVAILRVNTVIGTVDNGAALVPTDEVDSLTGAPRRN